MLKTIWKELIKERKVWVGIRGIKKPTILHYLYMLLILLGVYYFIRTSDERRETGMKKQSYNGFIWKKFENNDGGYIYLENKKGRVPMYHNTTYYLLNTGDSVIKKQNTYNIKVIRNDSVFYLNSKTGEGKYGDK